MFKKELKKLLASSLLCSKTLCQSSLLGLSVNSAVVLKSIFLIDKDLCLSLLLFNFPTRNSNIWASWSESPFITGQTVCLPKVVVSRKILPIVVPELFLILVGKLITLTRLYVLRMLFSPCFSLDSVREFISHHKL